MNETRRDLRQLLVEKGLLTQEQLERVYEVRREKKCSIIEAILQLGYASEDDLVIFFSTYLSIPPIKVLNFKVAPEVINLIPKETAKKYLVLPIGKVGDTLTVAVADALNIFITEDLERITGYKITPVIASPSELRKALDVYYKDSFTTAIEEIIKDSTSASIEIIKEEKEEVKDEEIIRSIAEAPVIKLTNYILKKSIEERASDVFIEPLTDCSRVRYRIDGILRPAQTFPKKMHNFVISRIKVVANLNITEHRLPQDGRFRMEIGGKPVDFRVSILPSTLGEKAVLRILDRSTGPASLDELGLAADVVEKIKDDASSSYGMILVTGPTGSGKTTTLYSLLRYIYTPEKNIITVEDPIEYQLKGINQVNVNYDVNLTFASALRSILRQDPDVIMVGEIRDAQALDIAIKAALTGHLMLSTLHTTTAAGSVTRLVNMGAEPFLLSSTLIGVLAQRLVRKLCTACRQVKELEPEVRVKYGIRNEAVVYKPRGCNQCHRQGYKGRVAVGEYLHVDSSIRELIDKAVSEHMIKRAARQAGMRTLREDGIAKVEAGMTSLEEVLKVTSADED